MMKLISGRLKQTAFIFVAICFGLSPSMWLPANEAETITIRSDGDTTYYEFRVNGEISEIKVVPDKGPEYYLVPTKDGSGDFTRQDQPNIRVPQWVIFRW